MSDLDERIGNSPNMLKGMARQDWAVKEVRSKGGVIWYPELSNFKPKAVGKNCIIHSHVWIGDEVEIGDNVKIQAFAFIPNGVVIGDDVFIGPHVCFTNDKVPPKNDFRYTVVKNKAAIGANATILPGMTIGVGALVGAGSVVCHNVPDGEVVVGNPAEILP